MEKSPEEKSKQEKVLKTARTIWMIMTPTFAALALFNLYQFMQGGDTLPGVFSQLGMTFVGLGSIVGTRNKPLYNAFIALGLITVVAGLMLLIMKF